MKRSHIINVALLAISFSGCARMEAAREGHFVGACEAMGIGEEDPRLASCVLQQEAAARAAAMQELMGAAAILNASGPARSPAGAYYLQGANPPGSTCDSFGRCR